jgi:hypothetical protein
METLFWTILSIALLITSPSYSQTVNNESVGLSDLEIRAASCEGVLKVMSDWTNEICAEQKVSERRTEHYYLIHPQE